MKYPLLVCICLAVIVSSRSFGQDPKEGGKPVANFDGHNSPVVSLTFSPDGKKVISASSADVRTWDSATGKEVAVLKGAGGSVVAISPDGKLVAAASRQSVTVRDTASGNELVSFNPHTEGKGQPSAFPATVAAMAFSPDGRWLATAGTVAKVGGPHGLPAGTVAVWDAKTGKEVHRLDQLSTGAGAVAFSADGKFVVAGTNGAGGELPEVGEVWVWDAEKGKALHTLKVKDRPEYGEFISAADVAMSPDGKRVAAAVGAGSRSKPVGLVVADKAASVGVWDLATGKMVHSLTGHKASVGRVVFSPDGKLLATAGGDRVIRLWDIATGKETKAIPFDVAGIDALAFSPDGRHLAAGGGEKTGAAKVWALDSGKSPRD